MFCGGHRNKKDISVRKIHGNQGFFSGVAILTLSALVTKIIGLFYKIPMMRYLGEEGMGYFNSAYEIYTLFYILATAGLPVAVSILVAENDGKERGRAVEKIFRVALLIFLSLGIVGSSVLYLGSGRISELMESSGARLSIAAISPMVLFVCMASAVRGFFQGRGNMFPTALSQIIEAVGKLALGLILASYAVKQAWELPTAAAMASLGMSISSGLSALYLIVCKLLRRASGSGSKGGSTPCDLSGGGIASRIIKIAVPITLSSSIMSFTRVVDLFMILRRLQTVGYSEAAANAVYGSYSTLAVSMFNIPAAFVTPIALALVPLLASAINRRDSYKEISAVNSSLRLAGVITIPASLGLSAFSRPLLELVFKGEENAINTAAPLLSVLGVSVFFSCLITVTNAILQGYGKEKQTLVSMLAGSAVKMISSYVLIGVPEINVYGAAVSTFLCSLTVAAMNYRHIRRCAPAADSPINLFGKTLAASVLSVGFGLMLYLVAGSYLGGSSLLTIGCVGITVMLYVVAAVKIGAVKDEELIMMPRGDKICAVLKKVKLIK